MSKAINSKQAARIRWEIKTGTKSVSAKRRAALAEYERAQAAGEPRPPVEDPATTEPGADPETKDAAPEPDPAPAPEPEPVPHVEAPPRVADAPVTAASAKASSDWRDPHRSAIQFSGDGRQMFCEAIADMIVQGLGALRDETGKVVNPKVPDPRVSAMRSLFVLAVDDVAPDRARLTPRVGAAILTVGTLGERAYHAKKIAEYLKTSPDHQAWLKKQAERERAEADLQREQTERAAREAAAQTAAQEQPPAPAGERVNGVHAAPPPPQRVTVTAEDDDGPLC